MCGCKKGRAQGSRIPARCDLRPANGCQPTRSASEKLLTRPHVDFLAAAIGCRQAACVGIDVEASELQFQPSKDMVTSCRWLASKGTSNDEDGS